MKTKASLMRYAATYAAAFFLFAALLYLAELALGHHGSLDQWTAKLQVSLWAYLIAPSLQVVLWGALAGGVHFLILMAWMRFSPRGKKAA
jgi:hypothetical protein